jgi:predicted phage-related endonuclease
MSDKERIKVVGGSEVSALFGVNPWLTHFELWHLKNGTIQSDFKDNERIEAGRYLEDAIITWACDRWGYKRTDEPLWLTDRERRIGGHIDCRVICPERGPGILEVKTVDSLQFRDWEGEPPLNYQFQGQTYMGLTGDKWCDIVYLVGGNHLDRFQMEFRPKLYAEIQKRVVAFWQSIKDGTPPKPNYNEDGDTLARLYRSSTDTTIDLTLDNLAPDACQRYLSLSSQITQLTKERDAAKAELLDKVGENARALIPGFKLWMTDVKGSDDRIAEPGEVIKGRKPYRKVNVKEVKK